MAKWFTDCGEYALGTKEQLYDWTVSSTLDLRVREDGNAPSGKGLFRWSGTGKAYWIAPGDVADVELYGLFEYRAITSAHLSLITPSSENDWESYRVVVSATSLQLNGYSTLANVPISLQTSGKYAVRLRRTGSTFKVKAWSVGQPEPDWQIAVTNTQITTATRAGFWFSSAQFVYALGVGTDGDEAPTEPVAPTPQPETITASAVRVVQVTATAAPTTSRTTQAQATAPAATKRTTRVTAALQSSTARLTHTLATILADAKRAVQSATGERYFMNFAQVPTGQAPAGWTPTWAGTAWVSDGEAVQPEASNSAYTALYRAEYGDIADGEIVTRAVTSTGTAWPVVVVARGQAGASGYVASFDGSGLRLYRLTGGLETYLGAASGSGAGVWHWIRLRVIGNTLRCRIWADGSPEPSTWDIEATDNTYTSGFYGIGAQGNRNGRFAMVGIGTNGEAAPTEPIGITETIYAATRLIVHTVATIAGFTRRGAQVQATTPGATHRATRATATALAAARRTARVTVAISAATRRAAQATAAIGAATLRTVTALEGNTIAAAARRQVRVQGSATASETRRQVQARATVSAAASRAVWLKEAIQAVTLRITRATATAKAATARQVRTMATISAATKRAIVSLGDNTIAADVVRRVRARATTTGAARRRVSIRETFQGATRRAVRAASSVVQAAAVRRVSARVSALVAVLRRVIIGAPRPSGSLTVRVYVREASMRVQPREATMTAKPREAQMEVRR